MPKIYPIIFFVSISLVIAAIVVTIVFGLRFGVDFRGGSVIEIEFFQRPALEELQGALKNQEITKDAQVNYSGDRGVIIRADVLSEEQHQQALQNLQKTFSTAGLKENRFDSVGPVIGNELKSRSLWAILTTLVAIAAYIALVFRKLSRILSPWVTSVATMFALLHDIILPVGAFALLGRFAGVEISAVYVAAVLTILGYSISDTVVVFDRVRENMIRIGDQEPFGMLVHKSIMQTLVRSLNNTFATLLSLIAIFIFGGESIRYFALALIIGIAAGAYSSIFIASPILVWFSRPRDRKS